VLFRSQDAVGAVFQRLHEVLGFQPAGTRGADDTDIRRILNAHGTGQVSGGIGAIVAAEGHDLGLKGFGLHGLRAFHQQVGTGSGRERARNP
jgi:hypothetical protein